MEQEERKNISEQAEDQQEENTTDTSENTDSAMRIMDECGMTLMMRSMD